MKYILSLFLTLSALCTSLTAVEYGQLANDTENDTLIIAAGDVVNILVFKYTYDEIFTFKNGQTHSNGNPVEFSMVGDNLVYLQAGHDRALTIVGPGVLEAKVPLHYKLTRASEVEYKNVNIISLPSSTVGQGTHEIVVEASDDLQTWTPVHSSSIGGSKAFFRTRVVEAGD